MFGILDTLLDLSEEEDGLTSIDNAVIVGQCDVHDWAGQNLASFDNRTYLGSMHAKNSALRHVDDWGTHHGAEHAAVRDGEGATCEVLESDFTVAGLFCKVTKAVLEVCEAEFLHVAENGHDQAGWSRDSR